MQIFTDWPLSHAKRATKDNRKSPEYHVVAAIRKLRTDKNCPAEKSKGSVITAPEKFENTAYFLQLGLPSTLITKKQSFTKTTTLGKRSKQLPHIGTHFCGVGYYLLPSTPGREGALLLPTVPLQGWRGDLTTTRCLLAGVGGTLLLPAVYLQGPGEP